MNENPIEQLEREILARAQCERHLQAIDEWAKTAKARVQKELDFHHGNALAWMAALKLQTGQNSFELTTETGTWVVKIEKARAILHRDNTKLLGRLGDLSDHKWWHVKRSPNWTEIMGLVKWRPEKDGKQLAVTTNGEEIPEDVLRKERPPVEFSLSVTKKEEKVNVYTKMSVI